MHEFRSTIIGEHKPDPIARKARKAEALAAGLTSIAIRRQEARITDQRLEDRHRNVLEAATIVFRRKKREVGVVNVSSRGAMLAAELEPRIGEKLDILFAPENKTRCAVRWVRDGRIGVEFLNETIFWESPGKGPVFHYASAPSNDVAEDEDEGPDPSFHNRAPRQHLLRSGTLYWGGVSIAVRLRNISRNGAQLESERMFQAGCEVELDLGDAGYRMAEVRWAKEGQVGLRFFEDFDLDTLAPREVHTEASPDMLKPAYLETELQPDSPWAARFDRLSVTDLRLVGKD